MSRYLVLNTLLYLKKIMRLYAGLCRDVLPFLYVPLYAGPYVSFMLGRTPPGFIPVWPLFWFYLILYNSLRLPVLALSGSLLLQATSGGPAASCCLLLPPLA